jgi:hypothetical protein
MAKRISQLTQITRAQLAVGDLVPVVDISAGQTKYCTLSDLTGLPDTTWTATGETWTYSAWDSALKRATITVPTDATTKYTPGMYVRFSQSTGGTKYGRIVSVTATTLVVYMGSQTFNNETVTAPVYSVHGTPYGLPANIKNYNPYRFSAYCSTGKNVNTATLIVDLQTELFDDNSNFASSRYTAPVTGTYQINGSAWWGSAGAGTVEWCRIYLLKNGSATDMPDSGRMNGSGDAARYIIQKINSTIKLTAGDYIELWIQSVGSRDLVNSSSTTFMNGFLTSEG